ncbi:MAG: flagellar biosynthesis anti-sigma factor FlgM [Halanaerobiales bacterium]
MDISEVQLQKIQQIYQKKQDQSGGKNDVSRRDRMDISARAQEIKKLEETLQDMPGARKEKVAALKAAVEAGDYRVDSRELAREMLNHLEQE